MTSRSWPAPLVLLAGVLLVLLPVPAGAVPRSVVPEVTPTAAVAAVGPAQRRPATYRAVMVFDRNPARQFRSTLTWRLFERRGGTEELVQERSWRAGSGRAWAGGQDACRRNVGWAPKGRYGVTWHRDYAGTVVRGGVFRMDDMACVDGTVRQQLFLHTEQGAGSRQCPDAPGDQPCRWELPRFNDYASAGCLKMAPGDLAELGRLFSRHFAAGVRHDRSRVVLRVVG